MENTPYEQFFPEYHTTSYTPSPVGGNPQPILFEVARTDPLMSRERRVEEERLNSVRTRLHYEEGMHGDHSAALGAALSLRTPGSSSGVTGFQLGGINLNMAPGPSQVNNMPPPLNHTETPVVRQPIPTPSQGTQGGGNLLEILKAAFAQTQPQVQMPPPPPPPPATNLLEQFMAALKPNPPPAPQPVVQQPSGLDPFLTQLMEEVKKQQAPPPPPPPPEQQAKEFLNMLKTLARQEAGGSSSQGRRPVGSKFCDYVAQYPLPDRQRVPSIVGTYDGTRDPEDHLALFEQAIMTEKWADPVACHMFPGTLQGFARDWFADLPERSVRDFEDLREKFISHFFQQKKQKRNHLEAHLIKQREGESLRDFISRYTHECQKIPYLPESQQISGFILSLLPGSIQAKLAKKLPRTFKELTNEVHDFVRSRETVSLTRSVSSKKDKSWRGSSSGGNRSSYREERRDHRREERRDSRQFTPYDRNQNQGHNLSKTPREILKTEQVGATFKPPPQMAHRSGKKNMNKYCDFHEDHGHDTNACRELKAEIKRALEEGKLEHLVVGAKQQAKKTPTKKNYDWQKVANNQNPDPGPPDGHVCMIKGGSGSQKRKSNVLEKWRMDPISFPYIQATSTDPIVI